jgi:hypothetical protein
MDDSHYPARQPDALSLLKRGSATCGRRAIGGRRLRTASRTAQTLHGGRRSWFARALVLGENDKLIENASTTRSARFGGTA